MAESFLLMLLLATPLLTGAGCWILRPLHRVEYVNVVGAAATLVLAVSIVVVVMRDGPIDGVGGVFYVDALSALMVGTIAALGFAAALFSLRYIRHDLDERRVPQGLRGARWYYLGLHAFVWTMLATVTVDNLGLLWVGVEATTLASALLVGFYRTPAALEAAWKYLILCTVGITFALFGVLLTFYAARQGGDGASLDWSTLVRDGAALDPRMMRLAFVFALIGFGTKAGFAPLHTWLADAHSQAPSPVSGVLSGVLLSCALYAILRFHVLTTAATGSEFSANLLLAFGVLSVAVATPFVLVQRDLKRLLAYSSAEHIGLMAVAFGIGSPLAVTAGLLHLVNHAATKALLFFVSGDLIQRFGTHRISAMRGAIRAAPVAGWLFVLGILAITGAPPFGILISEIGIAGAGFAGDREAVAAAVAVVLLLGLIFAGLIGNALRIAYGTPPSASDHADLRRDWRAYAPAICALAPLALVMLLFGVYVPSHVGDLLE
ncbi:MAG: hydrogenase 4 subunit F, partial [Thermomicrobiales bacterium]